MKYFVFVFFVFAVFFLAEQHAYGLVIFGSPEEMLEQSQSIFVGTITSVNVVKTELSSTSYIEEDGVDKPVVEYYTLSLDEYTVTVEEVVKNTKISDTLTVMQPTTSVPGRIIPFGGFEVGDRVLFYIANLDGKNEYSYESFKIPKNCDASSVVLEPKLIGTDFHMLQNGTERQDNFTASKPITFVFESDTGTLYGENFDVEVFLSKKETTFSNRVFHEKITTGSELCKWVGTAEFEFTLKPGKYLLNGNVSDEDSRFSFSNQFSVVSQSSLHQDYEEFGCNVNKESDLKKNLQTNPAVKQFLTYHPSSTVQVHPTSDNLGNSFTQVEYHQNGLGLSVAIFENDSENCFVQNYYVSYDYPSSGLGIGLSKSQSFESDQTKQAISAIKDLTNPRVQMKNGIPLFEIKCKEGLVPIVKIDRVTPACVTDSSWGKLLMRGWTPLRIGMPAETNILITYNATMVYPQKVTIEYDPQSPDFNMVFFVNNDIVPHTINAIDDSWSTGIIESGKTGSMSFNDATSYRYYIAERPPSEGTIVFEEKSQEEISPSPEPEPEPMPEENHNAPVPDVEQYISPFDEKLIQEFQKYHTVITGKVLEWYGQKQPSQYYYQYRVEALAHHTPRMQDDSVYIIMGDEDNFIPVDADVVLFGLNMDKQGTLYIAETVIHEKPEP